MGTSSSLLTLFNKKAVRKLISLFFFSRLAMKKESMFTMHGVMKTLTFTVGAFGFLTSMFLYTFLFDELVVV